MTTFIDTHCHIHFHGYKQDMQEVIKRSLKDNIFLITVGTQSDTSKKAVEVAEKYDGIWATIGLHPSHTYHQEFMDEEELEPEERGLSQVIKTREENFDPNFYKDLAKSKKVVAIGECGLDFYRLRETEEREEIIQKQINVLKAQLDLASELNLPVVIHCRDAFEKQYQILKTYIDQNKLLRRGVIHCFTGSKEEAEAYIQLGFLISFTGIITFPARKNENDNGLSPLQRLVKDLSLESIMIETDAPYLAPVPHRGKRNEPIYVRHVAEKIAELKNISLEEVAKVTFENAKKLFDLM